MTTDIALTKAEAKQTRNCNYTALIHVQYQACCSLLDRVDYVKRKCKAKASVLRFKEIPDHESPVFKWHARLVAEGTKKIQTV